MSNREGIIFHVNITVKWNYYSRAYDLYEEMVAIT